MKESNYLKPCIKILDSCLFSHHSLETQNLSINFLTLRAFSAKSAQLKTIVQQFSDKFWS